MRNLGFADVFCLSVLMVYVSVGTARCASAYRNPLKSKSTPVLYASCEVRPNAALDLELAETNDVNGRIFLTHELGKDIEIQVELEGLDPTGSLLHGFHVHEYGDLSDGCDSTGSHFNPFEQDHGGPDDIIRHVGDLGNIERDAYGRVSTTITDDLVSLWGMNSVYGRAFVIHADEDDLGDGGYDDSLTTGHAGSRLACCVIGRATTDDE
ncbi:superoxide dismutase [Cu-Zn]-like [Antedon mediterranea]|uniref:superoxide dismutase [Cu-Zn]-like n=1 Tax=Antedon mediterranea TaxID=105859 RepID=UPI003AF61957